MKNKLGLYVHIPFCESKCDYCNFISFVVDDEVKNRYVTTLLKEIEMQSKFFNDYVVDTIYIGGGTPSVLKDGLISKVVKCLKKFFNVSKTAEISCEANPNSLTLNKLNEYKKCGINRLSIGLQSFNNKLLKLLNRVHNKNQFINAIKNAKSVGFKNINVDLLLGVPKQKLYDVKAELKFLVKNKIPHISAYGLIVEENTKLSKNLKNKVYALPSEKSSVKMYDYTNKFLKNHGINRYEVSNFSENGFVCRHNLKYWNMQEYLGLGLVSSSYVKNFRCENFTNLNKYFKAVNDGKLPIKSSHKQTRKDFIEEYIMLGLRTSEGISVQTLKSLTNCDLLKKKSKEIADLLNKKMIVINDNFLKATDFGFHFLNKIILDLI